MKKLFLICFLIFCIQSLYAQDYYIPLSRDFYDRFEPYMNQLNSTTHTSFRPLRSTELKPIVPLDSLQSMVLKDKKFNKTWVARKIFQEHFLQVKKDDYFLFLDPIIDFTGGKDFETDKSFYNNSRGLWIGGNIGERFSFSTTFVENQAKFPTYVDSLINKTRVVPGQGRPKSLYGARDFGYATGTISFSLKKHFNFQFGHDKNFIGDGYRSLLMSDYAFNYPHLKINVDVWKVKYTFMLCAFQDLMIPSPPNYNPEDYSYRKKWGSFHYFDINIGKRASVGLLEGVIWKSDSVRAVAIDINYFNPFIFFRPVEFSMSSPDNAVLGLNFKFKISSRVTAYSQIMLDDFKMSEVKAGDGWYGNKQALQVGVKSYNMFGVKNLSAFTEFNYVRPFTYSHRSSLSNYGHSNEPLAHPFGGNFYESVSMVRYHYKNLYANIEFMYAVQGRDTAGLNYGSNIFLSYDTKAEEYGNYVPNGLRTTTQFTSLNIGYMFNRQYNLKAEFNVTNRSSINTRQNMNNFFISLGIKTSLSNKYFDF